MSFGILGIGVGFGLLAGILTFSLGAGFGLALLTYSVTGATAMMGSLIPPSQHLGAETQPG